MVCFSSSTLVMIGVGTVKMYLFEDATYLSNYYDADDNALTISIESNVIEI